MYIVLLVSLLAFGSTLVFNGVRFHRIKPLLVGSLIFLFTGLFFGLLSFWGEMLWFEELGQSQRFWTAVSAQVGFAALGTWPVFAVVATLAIVRRAGNFALNNPSMEILFTVVPREDKYKAKNFNDTVVYRGADAVSGWVKTGVDALAQHPAAAMLLGAAVAAGWGWTGGRLARRYRALTQ